MKLTKQQDLVLKSAILLPDEASIHWKELLSVTPFDELEGSSYRVVSAVYKNLEFVPEIPDIDRLKGAYRFNWARNSKLISAVVPVLREFDKENIDYRLLKGAALNLINSSLGVRTMGDIDLLISIESLALAKEVFEKLGFIKKYDTNCSSPAENLVDFELCYINKDNIEVDVHIAERKFPQTLFVQMLNSNPMIANHMGIDIRLPSYELALIHTVIHGNLNVSESDRMQSLIDCSQLVKYVDPKKLRKLSQKLGANFIVADYLQTVVSIDRAHQISSKFPNTNFTEWLRHIKFLLQNKFPRGSKVNDVMLARRILPRELDYLRKNFSGRRKMYFLWSKFGQFRAIERFVTLFFRGFLYDPSVQAELSWSSRVFDSEICSWIEKSTVPIEANDWRFKLKFSGEKTKVIVQMFSDRFIDWNWVVFVNGKLVGTTPQNEGAVYSIFLTKPRGSFEISLRSPTHICKLCYKDMSDLRVQIL